MKTSVEAIKVNHPSTFSGFNVSGVAIRDEDGNLKSTLLLKLIKENVTARTMPTVLVRELLEDRKAMKRKYSALKQENEKLKQECEKMKRNAERLINLA